jgi:hypothetical protein
MKNVRTNTLLKTLVLLLAMSCAPWAGEKVLVVVDGPYAASTRASGYAVNQYITDLTAAGNTVYRVDYSENGVCAVDFANHLYSVIKSYYDTYAINGAVLIGELPYAPCYNSNTGPQIFANDYFFMDLKDKNNVNPHDATWYPIRSDCFEFKPSLCDNTAEIWVSRITAINIYTNDALSDYGNPMTQTLLLDQYLGRLHQRMTVAEPQPKRFLAVGMRDPSTVLANMGFDNFAAKSISGWTLSHKAIAGRDCMSDRPSNWQAQLQRGPYGTLNGQSGHLSNGYAVTPCNSTTYPGIASDTFGFEWAGIYEHSDTWAHNFEQDEQPSSAGVFGSTDEAVQDAYCFPNVAYYDRALTEMYSDGGHPKARFIMDGGCSNLDITQADGEGELYTLVGNGLICFGSTVAHTQGSLDFGTLIKYLENTSGASFGAAFKNMINSKNEFPTDMDVYMLLGDGTLTASSPVGYAKKNLFASFTINASTVDDATNNCSGTITFTSKSVTGGTYNAGSTVYKWYDSNRNYIMQTGSSVAYSQIYADTGITINNHWFIGDIMIEAAQSGFLSGYIQTPVKNIIDSIPAITWTGTKIRDATLTGISNWWIDSIPGHLNYYTGSNKTTFDQTKATYKWYDKNSVLKTSTGFTTNYGYVASCDTLNIIVPPTVKFSGNYFIKAVMSGYRWALSQENTLSTFSSNLRYSFGVSGIIKTIMGGKGTITSFVPTVNSTNGKLDVAGTTLDTSMGGTTVYGCIGGTVWSGFGNAQVTAKDTLFSGSSSRKAGVFFGAIQQDSKNSYPYIYLYQRPDNSVRVRSVDGDGTAKDVSVAATGYTVGSTWLRINRTNDTLFCYASKNNSTYSQVYKWRPTYISYSELGVLYSSAGSAGSVRFVNINVSKK